MISYYYNWGNFKENEREIDKKLSVAQAINLLSPWVTFSNKFDLLSEDLMEGRRDSFDIRLS